MTTMREAAALLTTTSAPLFLPFSLRLEREPDEFSLVLELERDMTTNDSRLSSMQVRAEPHLLLIPVRMRVNGRLYNMAKNLYWVYYHKTRK